MKMSTGIMLVGAAIFAGLVYLGKKSTVNPDGTQSNALQDFLAAAGGGGGSVGSSSSSSTADTQTPLEKARTAKWLGLSWFWQDTNTGAVNSGTMDGDIDANLRAGWQLADVRDIGNDGTLDLVWYKGGERSIWTAKR